MKQLGLIKTGNSADFSRCGKYRYNLVRMIGPSKPLFVYVGLNPSYAGDEINDPTTVRNLHRAIKAGCGQYIAVNLFAFIATNPPDMMQAENPVGPKNDAAILKAVKDASIVLCGWGIGGCHRGRDKEVMALLRKVGAKTYCLGLTKAGQPKHPLYIGYDVEPKRLPQEAVKA